MASGPNSITVPRDMEKKKSPQLSFKRRTVVANSDSVSLLLDIYKLKINTDVWTVGR